jgi:predicted RNase H-like HicB family nuclease
MKLRYVVVLDREEDGRHIASVPGVPGCHAYGNTRKQAITKARQRLDA